MVRPAAEMKLAHRKYKTMLKYNRRSVRRYMQALGKKYEEVRKNNSKEIFD